MTKITKTSLTVIAILIIGIILLSVVYIQTEISKLNTGTADLLARKEDLIAQQKQLQDQISYLNSTLQAEIANQKKLSNQLTTLTGQTNNQGTSPPTNVPSAPTPTPTPSPPPVTRAS